MMLKEAKATAPTTKKARLSVLGELFGRLLSLDQLRTEQICCANPGLSRK